MPERRRSEYDPYQLPFEWSGSARELSQHVRQIREPIYVRTTVDAVSYFLTSVFVPFDHFKQEQLYVLLLDQKNRITHDVMVYKGTVYTVNVRTAEIFMEAVRYNSPTIIMSHCHPSGDPTPSSADIQVTRNIVAAGQLLDIQLLDHIIVGDNTFVSLREQRLGFPPP